MNELIKILEKDIVDLSKDKYNYDNKILPPYTKEEIKEYEKLNKFKLPKDFKKYITEKTRVIHRLEYFCVFQIYEEDEEVPSDWNFFDKWTKKDKWWNWQYGKFLRNNKKNRKMKKHESKYREVYLAINEIKCGDGDYLIYNMNNGTWIINYVTYNRIFMIRMKKMTNFNSYLNKKIY